MPAYESLQENGKTAQRMIGALLRGVSTREYAEVLPEMAETAGVTRSSVSRQAIEGSVEQLRQLRERRWEEIDLLVLYIDGQRFGSHHVISAVGIDRNGSKHVLGIQVGATENAAAVKQLLTNLRDQGLPTGRKYLFVIDGAKALRAAIDEVFGTGSAGAALPQSQDAKCHRRAAERAATPRPEPHAGSLAHHRRRRRREAVGTTGAIPGARTRIDGR